MSASSAPNWLLIIGLVYVAYAFGLLALAALQRGVRGDAQSLVAAETRQRACFAFAGVTGLLGAAMQALGQTVQMDEGIVGVVMLLGLVVLLLIFIAFSERLAEASRTTIAKRRAETLSVVPAAYGQAAE